MKTSTPSGLRRPVLSIAVVVLVGVGVSAFLWQRERAFIARDHERQLVHLAQRMGEDVRSRFGRIEQALQGLRGLHAVARRIQPAEWQGYLDHLEPKVLPSVTGFTYVRRVTRENEAVFLADMRAMHGADFALGAEPAGGAAERAIIALRSSRSAGPTLIGTDLSSRPAWGANALVTRRTGLTALTETVPSLNPPHAPLLVLLMPIYEAGLAPAADDARMAAHHGWIYAHLDPDALFAHLHPDLGHGLQLAISDSAAGDPPARFLWKAPPEATPGDQSHEFSFPVFNRTWRILLSARGDYLGQDRAKLAGQLFAGGLLATALLASLLWNLGRTQRKAVELADQMTRELREQGWMFQHAQRIANIGVCYWDQAAGSLVRSADYLRIFGLTERRATSPLQDDALAVVHADDRPRAKELFARLPSGAPTPPIVFRVHPEGRSERTLLAEQGFLPSDNGLPGLAIVVVHDITDRVAADRALAESHAQLERLMRVLPGAVFQLRRDAGGRLELLFMSEGATALFGVAAAEFVRDSAKLPALFAPPEAEQLRQTLDVSAKTLAPWQIEVPFAAPGGGRRWTRFNAIVERAPGGDAVIWHGVAIDITAAKEAEMRLRFTQFAVDHVRDAVAFITPEADRIYVNDETCRLTGYTREELLGAKIWTTFTAFTEERYCHLWGVVKRQGTHIFEAFLVTKAGEQRPVEVSVSFIDFGGREIVFAIARDISARKAAEVALRGSEERLRFTQYALDHAQDVVTIMDRDGSRLHVNETYCRYTGFTREELLASKVWDVVPALGRERYQALWDDIRRCGTLTFEIDVVAKNGEHKPLETCASFLTFGGREVVCTVSRDLTLRKAAELEKKHMEQQLRETQKLESLGVLAGGIAHDFNNLLTGILGNASLARDRLADGDGLHEPLRQIERASSRAAELCQQMLAYAGKGRFIVEPVDLSALVEDTAKLLDLSVARRARLELKLDSDLPAVLADSTQMRQIVMNLVINAAEAIAHAQGRIVVTTGRMRVDRAFLSKARVAAGLPEGEAVYLEVTDNGCGMDRATQDRIFEPFFTTKFTGRGLGLAAVLGIVRSHQGALSVQSEPGVGTGFRLVLAPHEGRARPSVSPFAEIASAARENHGRILVIDDEESVRSVTKQALERTGFTVELAEDGETGLARLRAEPEGFVLILLDYTMPRLDGAQTLRGIRLLNPRARVVMMSGFSEVEARERLGEEELTGFIQKPFDLPTLRRHVEAAVKGG